MPRHGRLSAACCWKRGSRRDAKTRQFGRPSRNTPERSGWRGAAGDGSGEPRGERPKRLWPCRTCRTCRAGALAGAAFAVAGCCDGTWREPGDRECRAYGADGDSSGVRRELFSRKGVGSRWSVVVGRAHMRAVFWYNLRSLNGREGRCRLNSGTQTNTRATCAFR